MDLTYTGWVIGAAVVACWGACIGSFLNVCIYRVPLNQSIVSPRSHCMTCGAPIAWYHNIPVVSYFIVRGRCAACRSPFSIRYAVVEALTALLFVAVWFCYVPWKADPFSGLEIVMTNGKWCFLEIAPPLGMQAVSSLAVVPVYWVVLCGLIIATFIDLDHLVIPDFVTVGGMVMGVAVSALLPELHGQEVWWRGLMSSALGVAIGFGVLWAVAFTGKKVLKKEAMGMGDVFLMGAVGAFFGWVAAAFVIVAGSLFGTVGGLALMATKRARFGVGIPFGPYLALATAVWMFWGWSIVWGYLRFLAGT